jgi:hypothetical protein
MKLIRQVGAQTSYLMPQFHCFGMAEFRQIENYDGTPIFC